MQTKGGGSAVCDKLHERISQSSKNISRNKIANNSDLSPSALHNIVKGCRDSGEISVFKGQKPVLKVVSVLPHGVMRKTIVT